MPLPTLWFHASQVETLPTVICSKTWNSAILIPDCWVRPTADGDSAQLVYRAAPAPAAVRAAYTVHSSRNGLLRPRSCRLQVGRPWLSTTRPLGAGSNSSSTAVLNRVHNGFFSQQLMSMPGRGRLGQGVGSYFGSNMLKVLHKLVQSAAEYSQHIAVAVVRDLSILDRNHRRQPTAHTC